MTPMFFKAVRKPAAKSAATDKKPDANEKVAASGKGTDATQDKPDMEYFSGLMALLSDRKLNGDFGPDTVKEGHHVAFKAGTFTGAGKVSSVGRDGLTVCDSGEREHQIHWREVTGHHAGDAEAEDA